jgi:hypothetical protein
MSFGHVLILMLWIVVGCGIFLTENEVSWPIENTDMIGSSHNILPVSSHALLLIRLVFLSVIMFSSLFILFDPAGLHISILQPDGSRTPVVLKHFQRFAMFTVWSWILQVISEILLV